MGVARRIVTSPEAYGKDRYHVSDSAMPAYEEALFNYLKGIYYYSFSLSLVDSSMICNSLPTRANFDFLDLLGSIFSSSF